MFKVRLAMSVLHCRNNQIYNRRLIHQRRDCKREQRDNQERNREMRTEKALKDLFLRAAQTTMLKSNIEFMETEDLYCEGSICVKEICWKTASRYSGDF